jgi:hypothetical protein
LNLKLGTKNHPSAFGISPKGRIEEKNGTLNFEL